MTPAVRAEKLYGFFDKRYCLNTKCMVELKASAVVLKHLKDVAHVQ